MHNNLKCVECHLPYDCKIHFYAKKIMDGTKDTIVFYTGLTPERIHASSKIKEAIQKNCIRCHYRMGSKIKVIERNCWACHRKIKHQYAGLIETL
ncbi:MAG: hypothetical protein H0Z16_05915 [Thermodesulfobacterium sp.]|nr:hypothetical protein [Thermodesulfobacterium sp.]